LSFCGTFYVVLYLNIIIIYVSVPLFTITMHYIAIKIIQTNYPLLNLNQRLVEIKIVFYSKGH